MRGKIWNSQSSGKEGNKKRCILQKKIILRCYWKSNVYFFLNHQRQIAAAAAKSLQSCPTLCDPIDGSPPGSPIPGILQARTLEQVAISFSNAWKWKVKVKLLSRVQLSDPMDCSLPGSSVYGIFQARVLEWGAIAFSVKDRLGQGKTRNTEKNAIEMILQEKLTLHWLSQNIHFTSLQSSFYR